MTADEEILACAAAAAARGDAKDAVVLATRDKNLQLRAKMADVDAAPLDAVRARAEARDAAWLRAYGHLLPDAEHDGADRRAYLRDYGA